MDLTATGGTPTPYAYAEAAAILMGTKTGGGNYSDSSTDYFQTSIYRSSND